MLVLFVENILEEGEPKLRSFLFFLFFSFLFFSFLFFSFLFFFFLFFSSFSSSYLVLYPLFSPPQAHYHSLQADHHIFVNLNTYKFYCLPDNYEVVDSSLADIDHIMNPKFAKVCWRRGNRKENERKRGRGGKKEIGEEKRASKHSHLPHFSPPFFFFFFLFIFFFLQEQVKKLDTLGKINRFTRCLGIVPSFLFLLRFLHFLTFFKNSKITIYISF